MPIMEQPQDREFTWEKIQNKIICRECKEDPPRFTEEYSSGDMVCLSCGLVADIGGSIIDNRAEWRTFSGDNEDSRADPTRAGDGANPYFMGDQLKTRISGEGGDSVTLSRTQGKVADENEKINDRLRKLYASAEAWCVAGRLNGVVVDISKQYIKLAYKRNWWRSINDEVIFACIYNACKEAGVARTMKEISQIPSAPPHWMRQVTKLQKLLAEAKMADPSEIGGPSDELQHIGEVKLTTAADIMIRLGSDLGLEYWAIPLAQQISKATSEAQTFDSRAAPTVSGAILYVLLHLIGSPMQVEDIAILCGVQRPTILKAAKKLVEHKDVVTNLRQWPADQRIKPENWKNVLAPEWSKKGRKTNDQGKPRLRGEGPGTIKKPEIGNPPSTQRPPKTPVTNPRKRSRDSCEDDFGSVKREKPNNLTGPPTPNSPSPGMFTGNEFVNLNAKSRESPTAVKRPKGGILCGTGFRPASEQKVQISRGGLWLPSKN